MARSLRASEEGIKQIKRAMKQAELTQKALAEACSISRSTITSLLSGRSIERNTFEELCEFLKLDIQDIQDIQGYVNSHIELLVKEVKQKIADDITERCGTMRVLDMTQPIDLERIYTDVNILKQIVGRRRISYEELMEIVNREHFDHFLIGTIQERVAGLAAVDEFQKLMILGKPGAGKTTFLKYLAMSCLQGKFHGELVPVFVTLKAYAETKNQPSLQDYILGEFQRRKVSADTVAKILEAGKAFILLDGLDEVKTEDDYRVKRDIDELATNWQRNRFAITCRIAAREYYLEKFVDVEVADFDDQQIATFIKKWFHDKDVTKTKKLLEKLKDDRSVKELANNPLLLTLLCLVFWERNDFPPKRAELYKEGIEILLKKWDAKRNIEREQIYKHLSPQNKEDMLGHIAFNTFVKGEYFFQQEDLQNQIKTYICNLPEAVTDPEVLQLDSEVVLKAIEHHHGLLVERARKIYSFSHLTFHEYFTAREIDRRQEVETLVQYVTEPRWREVFYLTAEVLRLADKFLILMKESIGRLLADDKKLQDFLGWANAKTNSVRFKYKTVAVRAFYASMSFYAIARARALVLDLVLILDCTLNLDHALDLDLALDLSLTRNLALALDRAINLDLTVDLDLTRAINAADPMEPVLQALKDKLPNFEENKEEFFQWCQQHGREWKQELQRVCIEYRNIGHDWQFTEEQVEKLEQYYGANLLLVECMKRSYVSKEVREEIEATLLLPIALLPQSQRSS